jgi:hypothetical protein
MGTIQNAIDLYLPDVYEKVRDDRYITSVPPAVPVSRFTITSWHTANHATDLAARQTCNAFDLIRLHKFPDEDPKKSFTAMSEWAASLPEVSRLLLEEKQNAASTAFSEDSEADWQDRLIRDKKGNLLNSLHNLGLIMTYDPYMKNIVFNQLADGMISRERCLGHTRKEFEGSGRCQIIWYVIKYGSCSSA